MRILIVRHGEPNYEIDSLTEKGWREADYLAERLVKEEVKAFYCSPLGRARDTAKATLARFGKEATVCPWLREFAGYIRDEKTGEKDIPWDLYPDEWTKIEGLYDKDAWLSTPLMQSGDVEEQYRWVCEGLDTLFEEYGYRREGGVYRVLRECSDTVVFFCHFGVECVLLSHLMNVSPVILWQGLCALPSSVTEVVTEERKEGIASFRALCFGDLSHLYANGEKPSFSARFCELYSNKDERH